MMVEKEKHRNNCQLAGLRFGSLTAIRHTGKKKNRYLVWECVCDCGGRVEESTKRLQRGTTVDCGCGCGGKAKTARKGSIAEDLTGQKFGMLTVLERAENVNGKTAWLCRCDCGNTRVAVTSALKSGHTWSCGCKTRRPEHTTRRDLTGKRFGRLTALEPLDRRDSKGSVFWRCRCDCGNIAEVSEDCLMHGNTISCGCRKQEIKETVKDTLHFVDGTCIEWLKSRKSRSDNTSGFRGVTRYKGRYRVGIGLQKQRYHLGYYDTLEEACMVRLQAEKLLHEDFVLYWSWWQEIATADPAWAKKNPFEFTVTRNGKQIHVDVPVLEAVKSYHRKMMAAG